MVVISCSEMGVQAEDGNGQGKRAPRKRTFDWTCRALGLCGGDVSISNPESFNTLFLSRTRQQKQLAK
jgi:hypothetical protein